MAAVPVVGLIAVMEDEAEAGGLSGTAGKKQVTLYTVSASWEEWKSYEKCSLHGIMGIKMFVIAIKLIPED